MRKYVYVILGFIYITKTEYALQHNSKRYTVEKWSIFGIPVIKNKIIEDY